MTKNSKILLATSSLVFFCSLNTAMATDKHHQDLKSLEKQIKSLEEQKLKEQKLKEQKLKKLINWFEKKTKNDLLLSRYFGNEFSFKVSKEKKDTYKDMFEDKKTKGLVEDFTLYHKEGDSSINFIFQPKPRFKYEEIEYDTLEDGGFEKTLYEVELDEKLYSSYPNTAFKITVHNDKNDEISKKNQDTELCKKGFIEVKREKHPNEGYTREYIKGNWREDIDSGSFILINNATRLENIVNHSEKLIEKEKRSKKLKKDDNQVGFFLGVIGDELANKLINKNYKPITDLSVKINNENYYTFVIGNPSDPKIEGNFVSKTIENVDEVFSVLVGNKIIYDKNNEVEFVIDLHGEEVTNAFNNTSLAQDYKEFKSITQNGTKVTTMTKNIENEDEEYLILEDEDEDILDQIRKEIEVSNEDPKKEASEAVALMYNEKLIEESEKLIEEIKIKEGGLGNVPKKNEAEENKIKQQIEEAKEEIEELIEEQIEKQQKIEEQVRLWEEELEEKLKLFEEQVLLFKAEVVEEDVLPEAKKEEVLPEAKKEEALLEVVEEDVVVDVEVEEEEVVVDVEVVEEEVLPEVVEEEVVLEVVEEEVLPEVVEEEVVLEVVEEEVVLEVEEYGAKPEVEEEEVGPEVVEESVDRKAEEDEAKPELEEESEAKTSYVDISNNNDKSETTKLEATSLSTDQNFAVAQEPVFNAQLIEAMLDDEIINKFSTQEKTNLYEKIAVNYGESTEKTMHDHFDQTVDLPDVISLVQNIADSALSIRLSAIGVSAGDEEESKVEKGLWVKGLYGKQQQKSSKKGAGYSATSYGSMVGLDLEFDNDLVLGVAASNINSNFKFSGKKSGDQVTANSYGISVYGSKEIANNLFFKASFSAFDSGVNVKLQKKINSTVLKDAKAKFKSFGNTLDLGLSYVKKFENGMSLVPNIGIKYAINSDSYYEEKGSGLFNVAISSKKSRALTAKTGATVNFNSFNTANIQIIPSLNIDVTHKLHSKSEKVTAKLKWQDKEYIKDLKLPSEHNTHISISPTLTIRKGSVAVSANYDFTSGKKFRSHSGSLKLRVNF